MITQDMFSKLDCLFAPAKLVEKPNFDEIIRAKIDHFNKDHFFWSTDSRSRPTSVLLPPSPVKVLVPAPVPKFEYTNVPLDAPAVIFDGCEIEKVQEVVHVERVIPFVITSRRLAFETAFILSMDRVLNELVYPKYDIPCRVYSPSRPIIQLPKLITGRVCSKAEIDLLLQIGCVESHPGPPKKKNKNGKVNAKRKRPQNDKRSPSGAGTMWLAPKSYGVPDAARVKLRYTIPLTQLTGGGTTNSFRYTSNAYDVDPALGSTAMPGFAELAIMYARFRTIRMTYHFTLTNQEAFPAQYVHGFMTQSLGSTAVGANYAGNRHLRQGIISPINGSNSTLQFHQSIEIAALFGNRGAYYDDLFTGSTTSSTLSSSATAHCYIGTVSAAVPVNGQFVAGYIELDLIFDKLNAMIV